MLQSGYKLLVLKERITYIVLGHFFCCVVELVTENTSGERKEKLSMYFALLNEIDTFQSLI